MPAGWQDDGCHVWVLQFGGQVGEGLNRRYGIVGRVQDQERYADVGELVVAELVLVRAESQEARPADGVQSWLEVVTCGSSQRRNYGDIPLRREPKGRPESGVGGRKSGVGGPGLAASKA